MAVGISETMVHPEELLPREEVPLLPVVAEAAGTVAGVGFAGRQGTEGLSGVQLLSRSCPDTLR